MGVLPDAFRESVDVIKLLSLFHQERRNWCPNVTWEKYLRIADAVLFPHLHARRFFPRLRTIQRAVQIERRADQRQMRLGHPTTFVAPDRESGVSLFKPTRTQP